MLRKTEDKKQSNILWSYNMSVHLNHNSNHLDEQINRQVEKFSKQRKEIISRVKALLSRITTEPVYPKVEIISTHRAVEKRNSGEIMKSQACLLQEELLHASQQRGRRNAEQHTKNIIEERKKIFSHQELLLGCQRRNPIDVNKYEEDMRTRKKEAELLEKLKSVTMFDLNLIKKNEKVKDGKNENEIIESSWNDNDESLEESTHLDDYEEIKSKRETIINEAKNRPISRSVSMYNLSSDEVKNRQVLAGCIRQMLTSRRKYFSSDEES